MTPKIQFELKCQNNPKSNSKNTVLSQNFWRLRNSFWAVKIFYVNKKNSVDVKHVVDIETVHHLGE